jgi:uncharacterized protein YpmB
MSSLLLIIFGVIILAAVALFLTRKQADEPKHRKKEPAPTKTKKEKPKSKLTLKQLIKQSN